MKKRSVTRGNLKAATALLAVVISSSAMAQQRPNQAPDNDGNIDEIVVTGVLDASRRKDASIALSVISQETLRDNVNTSAADILRSVPGVFVNSALGEIRNVVFSRGVSANSVEAASGYFYVSMQEDGLPVSNVTFSNFGPDYFTRPDLMLQRVEALRGGSATITGPNAPGGIFNYISRTGGQTFTAEFRGRAGLEGDGNNPFLRGDVFVSGPISEDVTFAVSGFYRDATGARDAGFPLNQGGQVRANLRWDYGDGSLTLSGKYLDDSNGFFEFLPARNFNSPRVVAELGNLTSFLPPNTQHTFVPFSGSAPRTWDGGRLANSQSVSGGFQLNHNFDGGWQIANNFRLSQNRIEWNSGAVIFPISINDIVLNSFLNAFTPGLYTFTDRQTGQIAAQVQRAGVAGNILVNNLPNQSVLQDGVLSQAAFYSRPVVDELINQFTLTKRLNSASLNAGMFYARSKVVTEAQGAGLGVSGIVNQPQLFDITRTLADGTVQQLTNPAGFTGIGQRLTPFVSDTTQEQIAFFGGGQWELTDQLRLEGGVRYENINIAGANRFGVVDPTLPPGGLDGDPNTLFDNNVQRLGNAIDFDRTIGIWSYSGAASWRWSDRQRSYIRYSKGEKAPDLAFFFAFDSPARAAQTVPLPQRLRQLELGHTITGSNFSLTVNPFWSVLSRLTTPQLFTQVDGTTYVPPPLFATLETIGLEVEGVFNPTARLQIEFSGTLQDPRSKDFAFWNANAPGDQDDTITNVPDGLADNNPQIMANTTARYEFTSKLRGFLTWRYLGKRAANRFNTFFLPAFSQFDLGGTVDITRRLSVSANINNAFNSEGVMSWAPAGGLLASLDRQTFTPQQLQADPNQLFNIITVQPRAFFLTVDMRY